MIEGLSQDAKLKWEGDSLLATTTKKAGHRATAEACRFYFAPGVRASEGGMQRGCFPTLPLGSAKLVLGVRGRREPWLAWKDANAARSLYTS